MTTLYYFNLVVSVYRNVLQKETHLTLRVNSIKQMTINFKWFEWTLLLSIIIIIIHSNTNNNNINNCIYKKTTTTTTTLTKQINI